MSNLFKNPSHVAKIGYNGFSMDHTLKFSSTTGELLPVYRDILQPGDKITISTELRTRTLPLKTSAMCSIKERIEWFFVPMRLMYSIFPDFYFGIQDFGSSLFDPTNVNANLPFIAGQTLTQRFIDMMAQPIPDSMFNANEPNIGLRKNSNTQLRLMELLGIPVSEYLRYIEATSPSPTAWADKALFPFFALAYQKIWYDYYRLSDRSTNDPRFYNVDRFYTYPSSMTFAQDIFTLRYRPAKKDFFTHLYTSPLMGCLSIGSFSETTVQSNILDLTQSFTQWLSSSMKLQTSQSAGLVPSGTASVYPVQNNSEPSQVTAGTNGQPSASSQNYSFASYSALSPSQIRTSFAVQKLLEITRRAGKHYDAQLLAHFGVDLPKSLAGECVFLGKTCDSTINIGDVISTAATTNEPLGSIAGKGYGYNPASSSIKYEAKEHGILLGIYSAEPVRDYSQVFYDRLNTYIDRASWPTPEFDNLGMQPLFVYQERFIPNNNYQNNVVGWQYRWSELKCKPNVVCGALHMFRSMQDWTVQYDPTTWFGTVGTYYVSPFALDSIMEKQYEFGEFGQSYQVKNLFDSDPLIHELYFNSKKASKMSTYGLETL